MRLHSLFLLGTIGLIIALGCNPPSDTSGGDTPGTAATNGSNDAGDMPIFSLAWSEYPSWSIFGVAHEMGLIDGASGKVGEIEKKWGVDIELIEASYDSCLNAFTSRNCDAVCMTNMDALIVSPNRDGVAILPTSTSNGADACVVIGIDNLEELKPHTIWGLEGTVSQYCFVRCVEETEKNDPQGHQPGDFQFTNQDPGLAAAAMAQQQDTHQAIMVWNPFVLQTLQDRPDATVLFDSSMIPGEIVDMVVVGQDVLQVPKGPDFAKAIIDTFYRMNEELVKPDTGDQALVALGEKFSNLGLEEMRKVVEQTQFYKTADDGISLLQSDAFQQNMKTVESFCVSQGLVDDPQYGFGDVTGVKLQFNAAQIEAWKESTHE